MRTLSIDTRMNTEQQSMYLSGFFGKFKRCSRSLSLKISKFNEDLNKDKTHKAMYLLGTFTAFALNINSMTNRKKTTWGTVNEK